MNISTTPTGFDRYASAARRELAETFRSIGEDCDELLASTGCPMSHALAGLAQRQKDAEACLKTLCQPHEAAGAGLPGHLVALAAKKDKTAHRVQMLHALAPIRRANFDRFERSKTPQEAQDAFTMVLQTVQRRTRPELGPVDD